MLFIRSFLVGLSVFMFVSLQAQEQQMRHIKLSAGAGVPEFAGIALSVEQNPIEVRLGAGTFPFPDDIVWSVYADITYHFAGTSDHTPLPPWYVRTGLLYMEEVTTKWKDRYTYLPLRIGRGFNLNAHWSIEVDAGFSKELFYERIKLTTDVGDSWFHMDVVPSFGTRVVYRIRPK
jgi:hypothetical protein